MNFMIMQNSGIEFLDNLLFTIKFLCPLILFYLAYKFGKRIKEIGIVSSMMGFLLYMIGIATFQFGTLLYTDYPDLDHFYIQNFKEIPVIPSDFLSVYNISNYVYAGGMVCFIVFTEINLIRVAQSRPLFHVKYFLSMISIITLIVLVILRFLDLVRKGVFFIGEGILMLITSWLYLSRFSRLYSVRKKKLVWIFFIGIVIGGISNFIQGFENPWAYFINALVVLIGAFMQAWAWGRIPSLAELNWLLGLKRLLVIKNDSSISLIDHNFVIEKDTASDTITGAAFGGFTHLLKELLASKEHVNIIDHGDSTIYFSNQERFTAILITSFKSDEYGYRLNKFGIEFGQRYDAIFQKWHGDMEPFEDAISLINEIFEKSGHRSIDKKTRE
jgi:hypothetical protein